MEVEREVKTFHVERKCDKEGCEGFMRKDREQKAQLEAWSNGGYVGEPMKAHSCTVCGAKAEYQEAYPTLRYKFIT